MFPGCGSPLLLLARFLLSHARTLLKQIVLDSDQRRMRCLACAAIRRETGLSTPTSPPAAVAAAAIPAAGVLMDLCCSVLKQACVSFQVGGEGTEKREQGW